MLSDIRSGMGDAFLMEKYHLSVKNLSGLFQKLLAAGLITRAELDNRTSSFDRATDILGESRRQNAEADPASDDTAPGGTRKCPSCGMPMSEVVQECLRCGLSADRFKAIQAKKQRALDARWACPSCWKPQPREFSVCPACGVFVAKPEDKKSQENAARQDIEAKKFRKERHLITKVRVREEKPRHIYFLLAVFAIITILVSLALYAYWRQQEERAIGKESPLGELPAVSQPETLHIDLISGVFAVDDRRLVTAGNHGHVSE